MSTPIPYALLSDQHAHAWSAFASVGPDGVNTRLRIILNEMQRAAAELRKLGGKRMYFAGDLFHVRGSIKPEVFNPTYDVIEEIQRDIEIIAIPGNHDLAGKETTQIGNAIQTLGKLPNFHVMTEPGSASANVAMIPWISSPAALMLAIEDLATELRSAGDLSRVDLIIHAPVNEVLLGVPDHGLVPAELAKFGFRRVFSGHYHDHKVLAGGKVISIGATTHQTWGDIGTRAGFLLVTPDKVHFRASRAPSFVEVTAATPESEIPLIVDGNYVRVRLESATEGQIKELRESIVGMGAKGVVIQTTRTGTVSRTGATVKTGASLEASVGDYVAGLGRPDAAKLAALCADILSEARVAE